MGERGRWGQNPSLEEARKVALIVTMKCINLGGNLMLATDSISISTSVTKGEEIIAGPEDTTAPSVTGANGEVK